MSDRGLPVTVGVRRPDGSTEYVRVGTAFKQGDGFTVRFDDLQIGGGAGAEPVRSSYQQPSYGNPGSAESRGQQQASRPAAGGGAGGMNFPNYGRSKGAPIAGASTDDLEFYANGARRSLNDPSKARWHDREKELLAAIEAELARQGVATGGKRARPAFLQQDSAPQGPPPGFGGGGYDPNEPPPPGDDDIAF